jgi:Flp pilus assembly pilin Flp
MQAKKMFQRIIDDETGAATAEYAIATMAAVGFAGLLVVIMRSDEVRTILFDLVKSALTFTNPNGDAAPAN